MNPHGTYPVTIAAMFLSFWRNRNLVWHMTKRNVASRYKGSFIGLSWAFLKPLIMLVVYTFVFSIVFKARWGEGRVEGNVDFAIVLFCGLIIHGFVAECINSAPGLISRNSNYVTKLMFPLDILPMIVVGAALFNVLVSLLALVLVMFLNQTVFYITIVFLPLIFFPFVFVVLGITWLISSTGVYVRDLDQSMGIVSTVLLFVSPIFFPMSAIPIEFQNIVYLNPLTFVVDQVREVLVWGNTPDWLGLLIYSFFALLFAWFGFWWFQRTRKGFSDVI